MNNGEITLFYVNLLNYHQAAASLSSMERFGVFKLSVFRFYSLSQIFPPEELWRAEQR